MSEATTAENSLPPKNGTPGTEESATNGNDDVEMGDDEERNKRKRTVRQVEFYFADSNLPYDKFMWSLHSKDLEHWVPIDTITGFKRMRPYSKHGIDWVAEALRSSEYLEVDESGKKVRRKDEVQEPKGQFVRSVYAKGFPDEDETLQQRLEDFFQSHASTNEVRMRRDEDKKFKNSVFVEFTEPNGVKTFLNADPKPSFDGKELLIMTKEAYCEMKIKEKGLTGKAADRRRDNFSVRRGFNAFTIPKKDGGLLPDDAPTVDKSGKKRDVFMEYFGEKLLITKDNHGNGTVKEDEIPIVKGSTLKFEGVGDNFSWNDIKNPIRELFDNKSPYIEYNRGDNHGLVGFHAKLSEEDIEKVKGAVKTINGNPITWLLISEEDEKAFVIKRAQSGARFALRQAEESADQKGKGKGKGNQGGRGGRGGSRGGRGGRGGGRGGRGGRKGGDDSRSGDGNAKSNDSTAMTEDATVAAGEKRKRDVEPDGGPDVGVRGQDAPPTLQPAKKAKVDGEDS